MKTIFELLAQKGKMRYGQLIWNALCKAGLIEAPEGNILFYIDDFQFAFVLEKFLKESQ